MIPETYHNELIKLLEKEYNLYVELEKILSNERDTLASMNYEKLNDLNFKKEGVLLNIIEVKKLREKVLQKIAEIEKVNQDDLTLSYLISITKDEKRNLYQHLMENFKKIGEKIKNLNEINKFVIKNSLNFIEKSITMINQQLSPSTYSNYGKLTSRQSFASIYTNKI